MPGLIVKDGGTNEDPVESAVSYDRFLPVLVCVHLLQQKRKNHVVEEETTVPSTIPGAHPRDANQARDVLCLHRADERARRGREKRHLTERARRCTQRANDRVLT